MRRVGGLACFVVAAVLFVSYSSQDQQVVLFVPPVGAPAASMLAAPSAAAAVPTYVVPSVSMASSTLIASSAGDFGGYTIPIIGLAILAATVAFLAGPVEDKA